MFPTCSAAPVEVDQMSLRRNLTSLSHSLRTWITEQKRIGLLDPVAQTAAHRLLLDLSAYGMNREPHRVFVRGLAEGVAALERALADRDNQ